MTVGNKIVKCAKCKKEIFYIPDTYKMACKVTCISCGDNKPKVKVKRTAAANYARTKKGIRKDIHEIYSFRSATEANFARILQYHNITWKYEERAFTFDGYKTKPHVYIMDFELLSTPKKNKKNAAEGFQVGFYEIKGYMDARSRNKLRRLKKCYPEEFKITCVVLYSKYKKKDIEFCEKMGYRYMFYDGLTKHYKDLIPTWE